MLRGSLRLACRSGPILRDQRLSFHHVLSEAHSRDMDFDGLCAGEGIAMHRGREFDQRPEWGRTARAAVGQPPANIPELRGGSNPADGQRVGAGNRADLDWRNIPGDRGEARYKPRLYALDARQTRDEARGRLVGAGAVPELPVLVPSPRVGVPTCGGDAEAEACRNRGDAFQGHEGRRGGTELGLLARSTALSGHEAELPGVVVAPGIELAACQCERVRPRVRDRRDARERDLD